MEVEKILDSKEKTEVRIIVIEASIEQNNYKEKQDDVEKVVVEEVSTYHLNFVDIRIDIRIV